MDYGSIEQIMSAKNILTDPAFTNLTISLQAMPDLDGCPLGLYYPDTATIAMPHDASEAVLLHELGHRHGHYYHSNLSEAYAENYRKRYQKGTALLYAGSDFNRLPKMGSVFEEGEKGIVEIALLRPLSPSELDEIKSYVYYGGYQDEVGQIRVKYRDGGVPSLSFNFTKGADWLVVIGATVGSLIVLTTIAWGYAIYKIFKEIPWIGPVIFISGLTFIGLRALARRVERIS